MDMIKFSYWLLKLWPFTRYEAISLPGEILFKRPKKEIPWNLYLHELEHVKQRAKVGSLKFYAKYVGSYLKGVFVHRSHWLAYFSIPYEIAARKAAGEPVDPKEANAQRLSDRARLSRAG